MRSFALMKLYSSNGSALFSDQAALTFVRLLLGQGRKIGLIDLSSLRPSPSDPV